MNLKLQELNNRWDEFVSLGIISNDEIQEFNRIATTTINVKYWFYELSKLGASIWNQFSNFNIKKYSSFEIDFSNFTFEEYINFEHFHFLQTSFRNCKFLNSVSFKKAQFLNDVNFADAEFQGEVNFTNVSTEKIDFSRCIFKKTIDFSDSIFEKVSFSQVVFTESVIFNNTQFYCQLNFINDTFEKTKVYFIATKFFKRVDFNDFIFLEADFTEAEFHQKTYFMNSVFTKTVKFKDTKFFEEVIFTKTYFKNNCDFSHAFFLKGADFGESIFYQKSIFYEPTLGFNSLKEKIGLNFSYTLFKSEFIFKSLVLNYFINFGYSVFEQIPDFNLGEEYNSSNIDFHKVKISFSGDGLDTWTTDSTVLTKINKLDKFAWFINNKNLDNKILKLKKLANRGIKLKKTFELFIKFWRIKKQNKKVSANSLVLNYLLKIFLFPFFLIFFAFKLSLWPLNQLLLSFYGFFSNYGKSYLRPFFFLFLSYPIFYFFYDRVGFAACTILDTHFLVISRYIPFTQYFNFFNQLQTGCYIQLSSLNNFYLVMLQTTTFLLFLFFILFSMRDLFFHRKNKPFIYTKPKFTPLINDKTPKTIALGYEKVKHTENNNFYDELLKTESITNQSEIINFESTINKDTSKNISSDQYNKTKVKDFVYKQPTNVQKESNSDLNNLKIADFLDLKPVKPESKKTYLAESNLINKNTQNNSKEQPIQSNITMKPKAAGNLTDKNIVKPKAAGNLTDKNIVKPKPAGNLTDKNIVKPKPINNLTNKDSSEKNTQDDKNLFKNPIFEINTKEL